MHRDFKIGLGIGLLVVIAVIIWLCTSPQMSTESRAHKNAASKPIINAVEKPISINHQLPVGIKPQTTEKNVRFHIVEKGQTLSQIAEQYYGLQHLWHKILNANRDIIPDPNRLMPGTKLIIPE